MMSHFSANDLKTKGIAAIEAALGEAPEAIVSVRGKDRFVQQVDLPPRPLRNIRHGLTRHG